MNRANAVRQIFEEQGLRSTKIYEVAGKADTGPLFPEDPHIAVNRRVTITLMREVPRSRRICSLKAPPTDSAVEVGTEVTV